MDNSVATFIDRSGEEAKTYDRFRRQLGDDEVIVLLLAAEDAELVLELAREAHVGLVADAGVRRVISAAGAYLDTAPQSGAWPADGWLARLAGRPLNRALSLFVRRSRSPAGSGTEVVATLLAWTEPVPAAAWHPLRSWLRQFQARARQRGARAWVAGNPLLNHELDQAARRVERHNLPLLALVSALMTWLVTRRLSITFALLSCVGLGVAASEGLLALAGESTNLIVGVEKPLLFALLLASGMHVVVRYQHLRHRGLGATLAARRASSECRTPVSLALLTTALGFASLAVAELQPIRVFGLLTAAGALLGIPLSIGVLPELLTSFERSIAWLAALLRPATVAAPAPPAHVSAMQSAGGRLAMVAVALTTHALRARWRWPALGVALLACGGLALTDLRTDPHAIHYFPESHSLRLDHEAIEARGSGLTALELMVESDSRIDLDLLAEFMQTAGRLDGVLQVVGEPLIAAELAATRAEAGGDPTARFAVADDAGWRGAMSASDGRVQRVSLLIETLAHGEIVDLRRRLRRAFAQSPMSDRASLATTGSYPLLLSAQKSLMRTLLLSLLSSAVLMQLVLSLSLRSLTVGLVAMLPNLLPVALGFVAMWLWAIPLDIGTSMTAAVALGIAVDDTLHLAHGWRPHDPAATARTTGRALVTSSAVIAAGFLAVVPTSFLPARHFAMLAAFAMLGALLADLLVLPPLLAWVGFDPARRVAPATSGPDER